VLVSEKNNPLISIVMPSLNVASYIRECIESVIAQTLKNIEIICIDAGSEDGTYEILREYADKDSRIKLVLTDIRSVGAQNNLGVDIAKGKYIGFVETDDYVVPEMFETLYATAEKENAEVVRADYDIFFGNGNGREFVRRGIARTKDYGRICNPSEEMPLFKNEMSTWAGIYKKTFLEENDIRHNESLGAAYQDNGYWFEVMVSTRRLIYVRTSLYRYRLDNPNSSVHSREKVLAISREYNFISEWLERRGLYDKFAGIFVYTKFVRYLYTYQRLAEEYRKSFSCLFHEEILGHDRNGELDRDLFSEKQLIILDSLLDGAVSFIENIQNQHKKIAELLNSKRNILQFGLGGDGIRFIAYARERGFISRITAITDNNSDLWGKELFGVRIIPPNDSVNEFPDSVYLVTSINYAEDICSQLIRMGVEKKSIYAVNIV